MNHQHCIHAVLLIVGTASLKDETEYENRYKIMTTGEYFEHVFCDYNFQSCTKVFKSLALLPL